MSKQWCERCGKPIAENSEDGHTYCDHGCEAAQALEPPRYCRWCGRRMKVQVLPDDWRAHCVEHGSRKSVPSA